MSNRSTFTLEKEAYDFLVKAGGDNRSAFINDLLLKAKHNSLAKDILKANREEAEDPAYLKELAMWDATLSDGLGD